MAQCEALLRNDSRTGAKKGDQCGQQALFGQRVCRMHGGRRSVADAARAEFLAQEKLVRAARRFGAPRDVDPATALLEEVSRTAGHVEWLEEKVASLGGPTTQASGGVSVETPGLGDDALVWGTTEVSTSTGQQGDTTRAQAGINVWVDLLQRERTHLVKACTAALSAGLAERQVRLAEAQGALVAATIRAVLGDLGLSQDQWALVQEIVPRHLRALNAASSAPAPRSLPGGGRRTIVG